MKQQYAYSFITTWEIKAPISDVWQIIYDYEQWPKWWKAVLKAETLVQGDEKSIGKKVYYLWESILPYKLLFTVTSTKIEYPFIMEGIAEGELQGEGKWMLEELNGITIVHCTWNVNTNKKWMNVLKPILAPLFNWNHKVAMQWGAKGIAKKLNAELLEY
jgi:uncharacterized protein YndB with AHSA1/START domain